MRSLLRITLGVLCWVLLVGIKASIAQTPGTSPAAAPSGAPSQAWKSCAEQQYAQGDISPALMQAQFERPENIDQMLQNLRQAWERDWLLRPDFYDEGTLLRFFNGTAVSWKQGYNDHTIVVETDSRVFSQMSIVLEAHCGILSVSNPDGQKKTEGSINGTLRIYGRPVPELTLALIRQVFGRETKNAIAHEFAAGGSEGLPVTQKGTVFYANRAQGRPEEPRMGLTFIFSIPTQSAPVPPWEIRADDVVQGIAVSEARHRNMENDRDQ